MKPISDENYGDFTKDWGKETLRYRFTQFPNLLTCNLKAFDIDTTELAIILYLYSRRLETVTYIENILDALPICRNTLGQRLLSLENKGYLKRKIRKGYPNEYDLSGLYTAVKVYAKFGVTPSQNLERLNPNSGGNLPQDMVSSNKEDIKKKKDLNDFWKSTPDRIREAAERKRKGDIK